MTDLAEVVDAAAAYLGVRPRTVEEIRRRLRRLGYRADLREQAIGRLVELGYLDDAAFARAWLEDRDRARPRGAVALRRELRTRGVADDVIATALARRASAGGDEDGQAEPGEATVTGDERAARRLVERRRTSLEREPDPRRRRQKAYAMLARNGFDPDVCERVASAFISGASPFDALADARVGFEV